MSPTRAESLGKLLEALQEAGLDVTVNGLRDAFWLALQPGLQLNGRRRAKAHRSPSERPSDKDETISPAKPQVELPVKKLRQDSAPPIRTEAERALQLFGALAGENEKNTLPASPLRVPAGAALASKLALTRSLRPLRKRFRNSQFQILNIEATIDATADAGRKLMPVFEPRLERWYELIVVADSVPSMDVWFETLMEFEAVAKAAGVFRDIRHYRLVWRTEAGRRRAPTPVENNAVLLNADGVAAPAVTLAQTNVRRLIFVATTGSATHWSDGRMAALLALWDKQCSVALLHMLPEHFWHRVRTGEPELLLRTLSPGAPAAVLEAATLWWNADVKNFGGKRVPGAFPILPLDPTWMSRWAKMQMGGGHYVPAIVVRKSASRSPQTARRRKTSEEWSRAVDGFIRSATPEGRRLAVYLSRGAFTLPVARLVQAAMFGSAASQTQLAEVLLSGFIQRLTPADAKVPREWVEYRFQPAAAEILARGLRESDADEIAEALARHIERHLGAPVDFRALVYDAKGLAEIPQWAQPFAQLGHSLLSAWPAKRPARVPRTGSATPQSQATVRMYRQGYGDCFLVSLNSPSGQYRILINCGLIVGTPGASATMSEVAQNIVHSSEGRINSLILTQAYWTKVSGFEQAKDIFAPLTVDDVLVGWWEDPSDATAQKLRGRHPLRKPSGASRVIERVKHVGKSLHFLEPGQVIELGDTGARLYCLGAPRDLRLIKTTFFDFAPGLDFAIEVPKTGHVLLFADSGPPRSWAAWRSLQCHVDGRTVAGDELLARTVFCRARLMGDSTEAFIHGPLPSMPNLQIIAIPISQAILVKKGWKGPNISRLESVLRPRDRAVLISDRTPSMSPPNVKTERLWFDVSF